MRIRPEDELEFAEIVEPISDRNERFPNAHLYRFVTIAVG
jgi:hypothetical protein